MITVSYSDLREHLRERLDQVHQSRAPMLVTRRNGPSSVIVDKAEWDGLMETVHLLSSPANATRLLRSIGDAEAGHVEAHDLDEG